MKRIIVIAVIILITGNACRKDELQFIPEVMLSPKKLCTTRTNVCTKKIFLTPAQYDSKIH